MDGQIPIDASILIDAFINSLGTFWGSLSNTYRILFGMGISIWFLFQIPRNLYGRFFGVILTNRVLPFSQIFRGSNVWDWDLAGRSDREVSWEKKMREQYTSSMALEDDLNARFSDSPKSYDEIIEHEVEERRWNWYYEEGGGI
jgi:hypothetical protein